MRTAGVFVLAFVASVVVGVVGFAASSLLPDWDDAAGRGLGEAFRLVLIAVYVIIALILYGVAAWRGDRERHLKRGLAILCLVPLLIPVLGVIDNGIHQIHWLREAVGAVQMFVPLWMVALVQWLVLHMYLPRRAVHAELVST
jgi:ABC-type Fe3+ transport system permease subunit